MARISYAQNGEDIVLSRIFVKPTGFYIDVGAASPTDHSVTRLFYERGWRGINIEPLKRFFDQIVYYRPDEINLNIAIAETAGTRPFYVCEASIGMSTLDRELATELPDTDTGDLLQVSCCTLTELCEQYVGDKAVDFLKVDVEGFERNVLSGMDFQRWRPLALVIEATHPGTTIPSHQSWEQIVLDAQYTFALFDGVNRFYLRNESCADYLDKMSYPACVHDQYITQDQARSNLQVIELDAEQRRITETFKTTIHKLEFELDQLKQESTAQSRLITEMDQRIAGLQSYIDNLEKSLLDTEVVLVRQKRQLALQTHQLKDLEAAKFLMQQSRSQLDELRQELLK
jgi:FkbM family methyltransferase